MKRYEITYRSVNNPFHFKSITALVIEPDTINPQTGAMLFTHGWGSNRYHHQDKMEFSCEKSNLVCLSVEFRMSGYDFDPVKGEGALMPYDAGFFQVFDVLNGLRTLLDHRPGLNRKRIFHYGTSQGGHIALLSSIFAPHTFGFIYASSPLVYLTAEIQKWAGREFAPYELSVRNVIDLAGSIRCPVFLEHGTHDNVIPHEPHTKLLEEKLRTLGKTVTTTYYDKGDHQLWPTTTRFDAFQKTTIDPLRTLTGPGDDFSAGRTVDIPCGEKTLRIDWSKPPESFDLFSWK